MPTRNQPDLTVLCDVDEIHAPPSQPVLVVSVVEDNAQGSLGGDCVCLEIATVEETHKSRKQKEIASITVDRKLLLRALGYTEAEQPTVVVVNR